METISMEIMDKQMDIMDIQIMKKNIRKPNQLQANGQSLAQNRVGMWWRCGVEWEGVIGVWGGGKGLGCVINSVFWHVVEVCGGVGGCDWCGWWVGFKRGTHYVKCVPFQ
ncbi:MAG: hypothetical protein GY755_00555 [Chloroflexi bacterium]|nr:hypothetical protein [Chloroflexota bacterium]